MELRYCPGDEYCDEPYFYTSMFPEPSIPSLPLLPAMAHWHTYKFLAGARAAHKIPPPTTRAPTCGNIWMHALAAALGALR